MVPVETEGCLGLFTSSEAGLVFFYDGDAEGLLGVEPVPESGGFGMLCCGGEGGAA